MIFKPRKTSDSFFTHDRYLKIFQVAYPVIVVYQALDIRKKHREVCSYVLSTKDHLFSERVRPEVKHAFILLRYAHYSGFLISYHADGYYRRKIYVLGDIRKI